MLHTLSLSTVILTLYLIAVVSADKHVRHRRHSLSRLEHNSTLLKRFDSARFTYYEAGLGACGQTNTDSDFVRASGHFRRYLN